MRKFLKKTIYIIIPLLIFSLIGLFLPTTPRASKSLLLASIYKDSLLNKTPSPRILLIGGSNLSFGLNCKMIKDSLKINPINTAIHASLGLKYMIENTSSYIKEGDIVILVPEYSHFYRSYNAGSEELLRIIFDVNISKISLLNFYQVLNLIPYIPKYSLTKYKISEYVNCKENNLYSVHSFNEFGDTFTHWKMKKQKFSYLNKINSQFCFEVIEGIKEFETFIIKKKAKLYISYPGLQDISFKNSAEEIRKVEVEIINNNFMVLGNPERYMIPDSMTFDSPYHLNKIGIDYRTKLFIEDLKKVIK